MNKEDKIKNEALEAIIRDYIVGDPKTANWCLMDVKYIAREYANSLLTQQKEQLKKMIEGTENPYAKLDVYLDKVKNGNKDDMYDYGVVCERNKILTIINQLRV